MITLETLDAVARLANLSLSDDEREAFTRHLGQILEYADSLQSLDTKDVPPMMHARQTEALREDAPRPGLSREEAVASAPDAANGLFRVPRVIGG